MNKPAAHKILVVDDDQRLRDLLRRYLAENGFSVFVAESPQAMNKLWLRERFDVLILDLMMPGEDGLSVLRRLRASNDPTPVIMLTAKGGDVDRIVGLEMGADDYLAKPFNPRELLARINAVLRRSGTSGTDQLIAAGGLMLDEAGHRVTVGEATVPLGPTEYRLLSFFMTHPERVYSRSQLLDRVWGGNVYVEERTVDVHIRRLRKALEAFDCDKFIQTVRGAGYRFSIRPL